MAVRRVRRGSNFAITAMALFVILAVINSFSYRHFVRWDLTAKREYTVSQTTRELLGGLENIVNVKVYLSKNLPAELLVFERQLRDLLAEYENYGRGKLRIQYVVPGNAPEEQRELMFQGIRPESVAVYKQDTATQAQVYNTIVVQFESQREIIPSLIEVRGRAGVGLISNFEYALTSKVFKCQRTGRQVIGWLTNAPNLDLDKAYRAVRERVRHEWDIRDVRPTPPMRIAPDIALLVIANPRDFTDAQLFEIDQYLMRGGKILALVELYDREYRNESLGALVAKPTNFTRLLETYGLKVNQDMVLDRYCAPAPISRFAIAPYQFWVNIMPRGLNKDIPAVARLGIVTLPWTQTLDKSASAPATVEMIPLAQSSEYSLVRWGQSIIPDPRMPTEELSKVAKARTVIAALSGIFPSCFREGTPYPSDPSTTASQGLRTPEIERKYSSVETRMVVVGNAWFLQDEFLSFSRFSFEGNSNVTFFMNMVEWLALGKGLEQIRSREVVSRPIRPQIPDWQRNTYKVAGTFTMPVLVVVGGIVYTAVRRRRRRTIADRLLGR